MTQAEFHNNRSLFSDYYLSELVQRDPHWQNLVGQAWQTKQQVSEILESALPGITPNTPEAELEHRVAEYIGPQRLQPVERLFAERQRWHVGRLVHL